MLKDFSLLFVEDDADTRELVGMMFQDVFREIYFATNGEEGIELFYAKKPDIVVTDIYMPYKDGIAMVEEIRREHKDQPVILVSAYDDKEKLIAAINMGVNGFVSKPINVNFLYSKLEKIAQELHQKLKQKDAQEKEIEELYKLAHYDDLTKIPNRYLFEIMVNKIFYKAQQENKNLALFFIDIDNFKEINDTYGHHIGDKVLQEVSKNIKSIIRSEDIFARRSGDEFLLLVEGNMDEKVISRFAQKIIESASAPVKVEDKEIHVTISVGISLYPQHAATIEELIHFADIAMYQAKKNGKNSFCYF